MTLFEEIKIYKSCNKGLVGIGSELVMKKTGEERFIKEDSETEMKLLEFWQWNQSDLLNNSLRGTIAEFIVAKSINATNQFRVEWEAFDLTTFEGLKIEVKSAAYLQSWKQKKNSSIQFSIRSTKGWDANTNVSSTESARSADIYVFCLLKEQNRSLVNPLNLDQWKFFVMATEQINREKGLQKTIGINSLLKMGPIVTGYDGIASAIEHVMEK